MKKRESAIGFYVLGDYLASVITWYCVFLFRKCFIEGEHLNFLIPFRDNNFFVGILVVPELWLFFHYITGSYTDIYRKSRLQELGKTVVVTFFGSIIIFFLLLLNDRVRNYFDYYFTGTGAFHRAVPVHQFSPSVNPVLGKRKDTQRAPGVQHPDDWQQPARR